MINICFSDVCSGHSAADDPNNPERPERAGIITPPSWRWGAALLFRTGQQIHTGPTAPNHGRNSISEAAVGCRSRLSLKRSEVGAQFKRGFQFFFFFFRGSVWCDGSGLVLEGKTNKGKTRSQRLGSFHLYPVFPVSSSRRGEKARNERTSWRSTYCILRKPWRQGRENLWATLFTSLHNNSSVIKRRVKKNKNNSQSINTARN